MSLRSAVYLGRVRHRRRTPAHEFEFPMFMVYLDLAEIDRVCSMTRLWGTSRFCPARFRRGDYLARGGLGLDASVRACVREATGHAPAGPIRMLTHLRYYGYLFNPVTFYYCFDEAERLAAVVAEITNTPWNERHAYVLDAAGAGASEDEAGARRWRFGKDFHVSPFMPMDLEYDWTFGVPGESLLVHMNLRGRATPGAPVFDATLRLERQELTPARMRGLLVRYPLLTARVIASIHFQALRLWLKRAPVFAHPGRRVPTLPTQEAAR
ncbi:MAG: DUF1365 domain-containing protein [Planctomycetota bacterium]|nr:DUF1365 domain-containing protein [Planctomycetota bacterium]